MKNNRRTKHCTEHSNHGERAKIKRTTKQKVAGLHSKEGGDQLVRDSTRQTTMEGTDGQLHPAVDGRRLSEEKTIEVVMSHRLPMPQLELGGVKCPALNIH